MSIKNDVIEKIEFLKKYINNDSCEMMCCINSEECICFNCWILKYINIKLQPIIETIKDSEELTERINKII